MLSAVTQAQTSKTLWPTSQNWLAQGFVINKDGSRTSLSDHVHFQLQLQKKMVMTHADLPKGKYTVQWELPAFPSDVKALRVSAKLMKSNKHQNNNLYLMMGEKRWLIGKNSSDWKLQPIEGIAWPLTNFGQKTYLQWEFSKPHLGNIWRLQLADVKITPTDAGQVKNDFMQPMAGGLPIPLDPDKQIGWHSKLSLKNGMMFKDDKPFFPIGFVFGTSDKALAQAKAMGANAAHFEVGWRACSSPGKVPAENFRHVLETNQRAAQWDMASFIILTGHYVPGWFTNEHRQFKANPLGSDGTKTGSWFPYSIHYPPFRKAIANFWQSASPLIAAQPNVMGINFWNEPSYGGTWNKGRQYGDYSIWAIANYRTHLKNKYQTLNAVTKAHDQKYASFDVIMPPKIPEEMSPTAWLDWMEFGQKVFADFFQWERSVIRKVAPDVPLVNKKQTNPWDNSTASSGTNWHLLGLSEDIYGLNTYGGSEYGYRDRLDAARSYANGKPVVVFETNAMPANAKSRTPDRIALQLWSQIFGGADGMFIFAMIDKGEHGILGNKAADDDDRAAYARFVKQVSTHQRELASPHVPAKIAVLYSTTGALHYTQDTIPRQVLGAYRLIRDNHYQVDYLPQERCDLANLKQYELLVLPTHSILKSVELKAVGQWVKQGGKLLAFADSLAKDWKMQDQSPPKFLGIDTRKPPIGGRDRQTISSMINALQHYQVDEIAISGVELVSKVANPSKLLPGQGIDAKQKGRVLAYNSDSYPAILETIPGRVVYCAFESTNSIAMRHLLEGVLREQLGIKQQIRLSDQGLSAPGILTSLRSDYKDINTRYLLLMNSYVRSKQTILEMPSHWKVVEEKLGDIKIEQHNGQTQVILPARSVGLLVLNAQ